MVHFYRNVFSHVPAGKLREVALMLKAIHAQEDLAAAQRKAGEVVARLHSMKLGKAAELVETAVSETLAYYAFPEEHWRRIRTNNPLERIMREIRRRWCRPAPRRTVLQTRDRSRAAIATITGSPRTGRCASRRQEKGQQAFEERPREVEGYSRFASTMAC